MQITLQIIPENRHVITKFCETTAGYQPTSIFHYYINSGSKNLIVESSYTKRELQNTGVRTTPFSFIINNNLKNKILLVHIKLHCKRALNKKNRKHLEKRQM